MINLSMTYSEFWLCVIGNRTPEEVVSEFDLEPSGLEEWVDDAVAAAISECGSEEEKGNLRSAAHRHSSLMVSELRGAGEAFTEGTPT